jgi:orotidine-5'-phosphate decarboxylase
MDFYGKLTAAWTKNNSLLCVGLDPDWAKMPGSFSGAYQPLFEYNQVIIDATADLVCAFKPNIAFYESPNEHPDDTTGLAQLKATIEYIHTEYPDIPVILDAKRADIGNTNDEYVKSVFDYLDADAVTLHPYLGHEALEPFLTRAEKGMIILCRTSNPGAGEFQDLLVDGKPLYQYVAKQVAETWNKNKNCSLVVGATYPEEMKIIRDIVGQDMPFLVPGLGAQGGDVQKTVEAGLNNKGTGMIINSSRGIMFAPRNGGSYADAARKAAIELRDEINKYR